MSQQERFELLQSSYDLLLKHYDRLQKLLDDYTRLNGDLVRSHLEQKRELQYWKNPANHLLNYLSNLN
jgi:hypothetical protein